MARKDAFTEHLASVPLFSACSKKELQLVARRAEDVTVEPGKVLVREGAAGAEFFVIVEGTAEVRRKGKKIRTLGPGDFLGEISLVSRKPRTATVTAITPINALVITEQSFRALLEEQPAIGVKILRSLAERLIGDSV